MNWFDDPAIAEALAQPDDHYLATLTAKNDALFAALHDERGPLVVVNEGEMNAWLDSLAREYDVDTEAA